ncbi:MAG: AMP-binding protein [Mycobacterium sp.]
MSVSNFLGDLTRRWAHETPDDLAITFGELRWTWAEWDERVGRLAGAMSAGGITRGHRVGFLDKNHPACLEVVLAAARVGAAAVVLNWRLAGDELEYAMKDAQIEWMFCGGEFAAAVSADKVVVIGGGGDTYEALLDSAQPIWTQRDVDPEDLCVIMYSSGTTGRPKGVVLNQRNLVTHTRNTVDLFEFESGDINLVAMPLFHVGGTCYALLGIAAGVHSIMTREPSAKELFGAVAAGATHVFLVPPVIAAVLGAGQIGIDAFAPLKFMGCGAAPIALTVLQNALAAWPRLRLLHGYGQTEFSGVIAALSPDAQRDPAHPERQLSTGKPVPGAEIRVVDPDTGEDVPAGVSGEFWFRTEQQMIGYLNRPEDTAATITPDGWLRTGDIGKVDEDGYIFIEDRIKDMIITGGENVYSPEVERVLIAHPDIADVAVFGIPDDKWGESVLAAVVLADDAKLTADVVIAFAKEQLATYKCPRRVEFIDSVPRSPSGKILKRALRQPYWADRDRNV